MTKESYSSEKITVLKGLEAVRKRPSMYIGDVGKKGLKEALIKTIDWYEKNSNTKEFGHKSYVI